MQSRHERWARKQEPLMSVNIFLKIKLTKAGPVKGPCSAVGHVDDLLLDSIRWGQENTGGGKGGTLCVRNFEFTKRMCPGSVPLLLACASRDTVKEAVIALRSGNTTEQIDFLKWTLEDGVVSHYEIDATTKDSVVPTERISISFRTMSVEFKPRGPDGLLAAALSARVDLGANTSSS
jgi:type VI protein secretion system component Hcp